MNWDVFDFFEDVPELLDEEAGVNLVVNNIKKFLINPPKEKIKKEITDYLNVDQSDYYEKRKSIFNKNKLYYHIFT